MFAKTIIDSDAFLDMPSTAQLLYFHLSMRADDDGFINKPKTIMRMIGCKDDDIRILFAKKFLIPFDSGVVVIKHWRVHNFIRKDTYHETKYVEEKGCLTLDARGIYHSDSVTNPLRIRNEPVTTPSTQVSIGKSSLVQDSLGQDNTGDTPQKTRKFTPPTLDEVKAYCTERKNSVNPEHFIDYYEARGWYLKPGQKVKDWKACVRTWERSGYNQVQQHKQDDSGTTNPFLQLLEEGVFDD